MNKHSLAFYIIRMNLTFISGIYSIYFLLIDSYTLLYILQTATVVS